MKKILFVINDLDIGGLQRVVSIVADAINKLDDFQSSIFVVQSDIPVFYQTESTILDSQKDTTKENNIVVPFYQKPGMIRAVKKTLKKNRIGKYLRFRLRNRRIIGSLLDVIEKNNYFTVVLTADYTSYAPFIKNRFPHLKVISWQHNSFDVYMNNYFVVIKQQYIKGLRFSDVVVSLTKSDAKKFRKFNERSLEIPNPITINNSANHISDLKKHVISWVGRASDWQHKGTDYLLKIAAHLPDDWIISVAGDVDPLKMDQVLNQGDIERARGKIVYKGPLKGKDLVQHYVNSSIFLMTSRWEGFGLVITEAMSCGLPIVLFDQTGAKAVTNGGEFGKIIQPGDLTGMDKYLIELTRNINLRKQWQERSIARSKNYMMNHIIDEWATILN
ncbi:glycosyltransferase [Oenococcus oeni]|uniref:glycosyltransferase n=4 Tax=Oenococcus oeni TaxID=1247 RepID=UPI000277B39E|nr:glycosyltransferase [Oenococcus oeni]AWW98908.1 glycosyl transferase family 1 [Oenococcus oeni]EJO01228.1 glycosyl transferase group 1 [Oenococcus oeni AWRIB419]EJO05137.1 glycosyl transferase group 1 [Oenococcus oeni AWRIB548]EJO07934.1 glycosyl transferase group 1 [Oenococcus oeni AWRIB422]EKP90356.1 glycosyl transferase group 1 [Oenococcus oeni DSM 20252 = AWRIB129]